MKAIMPPPPLRTIFYSVFWLLILASSWETVQGGRPIHPPNIFTEHSVLSDKSIAEASFTSSSSTIDVDPIVPSSVTPDAPYRDFASSPWKDRTNPWYSTTVRRDVSSDPFNSPDLPPLQTLMVYRYYARQKTRTAAAGSIPFVLLGPNVDHWKIVAQQLSARGFNVICVGPKEVETEEEEATSSEPASSRPTDRYVQGPALILQLLEALRWNQIVLVACDREAAWAIQAALFLAPQRIAGLVLVGGDRNLEEETADIFLSAAGAGYAPHPPGALDRFLQERLACPFTIVWDGTWEPRPLPPGALYDVPIPGTTTMPSTRSVLMGGGTAPHRRRPGILAWILTRFVEERLAPAVSLPVASSTSSTSRSTSRREAIKTTTKALLPLWLSSSPIWSYASSRIPVLWNVDDMFNEESMVVFGRIVATAIFYAITIKVIFFQYGNVRDGIDWIMSTHRNIVSTMQNRISNVFSLFLWIRRWPRIFFPFWNAPPDDDGTTLPIPPKDDEASPTPDAAGTEEIRGEEKEERPSEKDLRPLFFLDHVVA